MSDDPRSEHPRGTRRAWMRPSTRGLGLGLGLVLLAELGLRYAAPLPPRGLSDGLFEDVDGLPHMVPGVHGTQVGRDFSVRLVGDERGYRAGTSSPELGPAARPTLLLGDSFAFGWGVKAEDTASARLVERGLAMLNRALPGDGLAEYAARLDEQLATGPAPGAIVVVLYDNDLVPDASAPGSCEQPDGTSAPFGLDLRSLLLRSHLVRALALGLERLGVADSAASATGYREARAAILRRDLVIHRSDPSRALGLGTGAPGGTGAWGAPPAGADLDAKLEQLRGLLVRARATAERVLLLRITPVYAAGGAATAEALERIGAAPEQLDLAALDQRLARLAGEAGVDFMGLAPATGEEERDWYFPSDLHLSASGHGALAELLAGWLGPGPGD